MEKKFFIKGDEKRGDEIIELLEDLGGDNFFNYEGTNYDSFYFIDYYHKNYIKHCCKNDIKSSDDVICYSFTIDEFNELFPFKMYDDVNISFKPGIYEIIKMERNLNCLSKADYIKYTVKDKYDDYETIALTKNMTLIENKEKNIIKKVNDDKYILDNNSEWSIEMSNGVTYLKRKEYSFPKTYEECCKILNINPERVLQLTFRADRKIDKYELDNEELMNELYRLKICRDAYWKILNWKPIYEPLNDIEKYCIIKFNGEIKKTSTSHRNAMLAFPTEKIRDIFYKNFKDIIEEVKELL